MDVIDEDRSNSGVRSNAISSDDKDSEGSSKTRGLTVRPPPLEILERITINKSIETPRSTIRGVLNVPIQTDLKFTEENLNKVEEQLKRAFTEFYRRLRLLKSYSFINTLAFSKIMKKYDKVRINLQIPSIEFFTVFCLLKVPSSVLLDCYRLPQETLPSPT